MDYWAPAAEFSEKYEVCTNGDIRNTVTRRILKPSTSKSGYKFVKLDRDGLPRKNMFVHRLVAETFLPNPSRKTQVNHIDGDKSNNSFKNLEWVTPAENVRHSFAVLGKQSPLLGKTGKCSKSSMPVHQYDLDGVYIASWDSVSDAARAIDCNASQIINVISGRLVTCHGYLWSYCKADKIDASRAKNRKTHKYHGVTTSE